MEYLDIHLEHISACSTIVELWQIPDMVTRQIWDFMGVLRPSAAVQGPCLNKTVQVYDLFWIYLRESLAYILERRLCIPSINIPVLYIMGIYRTIFDRNLDTVYSHTG